MAQLIVNADDFGLTAGVNESVLALHRAGALTSATLMATASYFGAAVTAANPLPRLGVGCHVVLLDGVSALPPGEVPNLAPGGQFRPTLGAFLKDLLPGRIPEAEIEAEAIAQIRKLQSAGVRVTHLDTHKHSHMFRRVLRPVVQAAMRTGVRAIRNPFEPEWALKATGNAPFTRRLQVKLLRTQRKGFLKLVRQAGLATTDGAVGVLATGTLDATIVRSLLTAMPEGIWELVCHPGYNDAALSQVRTRLRASREVEHNALLEAVPEFASKHRLIHFGDIVSRPASEQQNNGRGPA